MVPSSWLSVVLFFLYIAPGLLLDLLSEQRRAGFSESAFRDISRIVLASLVFSGFAFSVLAIVREVQPEWMPDPRRLLDPNDPSTKGHYLLIVRTLVLQGSLALTTAWAWHLPCLEAGRSYNPPGQRLDAGIKAGLPEGPRRLRACPPRRRDYLLRAPRQLQF